MGERRRIYFAWNEDGTIKTNSDGSFMILKRTKVNEDGSESLIAESQPSLPGNLSARFP